MQLLCMAFISIACAMLGFLSPANRGSMLTVTLLLFVLMGCVAGYSAAIVYKSLKGVQWKALTLLTAFLYPGITFTIFFVLNCFIWGQVGGGISTSTSTSTSTKTQLCFCFLRPAPPRPASPLHSFGRAACARRCSPPARTARRVGLLRCSALRHDVRFALHLVSDLFSTCVGRRLAWLPPRAQGPARQDQHGPARHPQPGAPQYG